MNGGGNRSGSDGNLKSFYAYKNTFDEASVWLEVPKQGTLRTTRTLLFVHIINSSETSDLRQQLRSLR